jgi:hypothetical protein
MAAAHNCVGLRFHWLLHHASSRATFQVVVAKVNAFCIAKGVPYDARETLALVD